MSMGIAIMCFIGVLLINSGSGLMCYKCNNVLHPDICGRHARRLTVGHVKNIELQCNGTCKIAAIRTKVRDQVVDVYMRDCDHNWQYEACNQTDNAKVCHCKDRDFCNYRLKDIPFKGEFRTSLENSTGSLFNYYITCVMNAVSGLVVYHLYNHT
ncbi:uncharacterized protein LOC117331616 isoform X2 [Pecten maximus]|uniref:uncharacterized protein LOC117331616 isoform X1 n=1 Tax=Pecten maximus TaxID=6579 RepID=UPI0014586B7D|nr:uncharacterized protein LOC117331616 isoform X1 [Pecten maximus]XP_033746320.1 uncharacterized protein LOC117331616 isoform X2 [Pecten maximus]